MKLFSGRSNRPLAEAIAEYLRMPLGDAEISRFCDGEIGVMYNENIRGIDVFIIQSTNPPAENLLELLMMIDAARRSSAKRITAVIPYFGYARQDRKDRPRVAISAKLVANLISTAGADRILTMDLHNASIQGFFDIPFDHLYGSAIFLDAINDISSNHKVVVAPDVGSSKRARAYANRLNTELALVDKKRSGPNQIETVTLIGEVKGKHAILVDDMVDTAGTLCRAAEALHEAGADTIIATATHALLSGKALEKINGSYISKVLLSDTVWVPGDKNHEKINILSSSSLFGEAIKRIHNEESISSLFDSIKE
jgi:ribose-phosphate pyrophosphokinase